MKVWSLFIILTLFILFPWILTIKSTLTGHYEGINMILKDVNVFGQALIFMSEDLPYKIKY